MMRIMSLPEIFLFPDRHYQRCTILNETWTKCLRAYFFALFFWAHNIEYIYDYSKRLFSEHLAVLSLHVEKRNQRVL